MWAEGGLNVYGPLNFLPRGCIIMFHGTAAPPGWAICNGSGGITPDLRGRFVLGINPSHPWQQTGGAESVVLTEGQMPRHSHRIGNLNRDGNPDGWRDGGRHYWRNNDYQYNSTADTGKQTDETGWNQAHENMPPYYALLYIMKL